MTRTRFLGRFAWAVLLALLCGDAAAHEGPPFPLLLDEPVAGHAVSIWADPDIGEAKFFIILETPRAAMSQESPQLSLWVEPVSGRLPRTSYAVERQSLRNRMQFQSAPIFDQRDMWKIGVQLANAEQPPEEIIVEVESTPPGFGVWDLAIYLFPFAFLGSLWAFAFVRRRHSAFPAPRELKDTA